MSLRSISENIKNHSVVRIAKNSPGTNPFFQPKLAINTPGDTYEQKADAKADKVMRMPAAGNYFFTPVVKQIQRQCAHCEDEEKVQMKGGPEAGGRTVAPPLVHDVINSGGQPLDINTRNFFEHRFGYDFSQVQVHNDSMAHQSSKDINALAYTHGNHIAFGAGQYQPNTAEGGKLLAHELTHVQQQRNNQPIVQKKPGFNKQCNDYQRCNVIEALQPAKQLVDQAIKIIKPIASGKLQSGSAVDLLNAHFKTGAVGDAPKILDNYKQIKAELDNKVQYNCFDKDPSECISSLGSVGGATDFNKGADIDLCAYFFSMNCTEKARELVHENTHHLGFTTDFAYAGQPAYQQISHAEAMENPDTYAQFARESFPGNPPCKNCAYEIQVKNKKY